MIIALGAMSLSCSKEKQINDGTSKTLNEPVTINFTIGLPEIEDPSSRASFTDELGITWEPGDEIWFTGNANATNLATLTAGDITEGGHKASFSITTAATSGVLRYNWSTRNTAEWDFGSLLTNYVNQSNFEDLDASLTSNTTLEFTQSEAGVMNKRFVFLHSATSNQDYVVNEGSIAVADVKMKIVGSIFRILPFTTDYSSEQVESIKFSLNGSSKLGGVSTYNYGAGTYTSNLAWNYLYKEVVVNLDTPFDLTGVSSKYDSKGIYFAVPRTESAITGGYTITVKTDQATYTYVSAKNLEVADNQVRNFPILLDASHRVANDEFPVDAYFYPTVKEKFSGMVSNIDSYVVAGDKRSATVTMKDNAHYGGAVYFDGGFNDIAENKVYVESFDLAFGGFGNEPGFVYNFDIYANNTGAERTSDVVFYAFAESNGAKGYFTLHFVQPAARVFSITKTDIDVAADATSATINVTAENAPWTAEVLSGSATIAPSSGASSGSIVVSFAANESTTDERVFVVRVSTTASVPTQSYDITITQAVVGAAPEPDPVYTYTLSTSDWNETSIKASGRTLYYDNKAASGLEGQWIVITNNLQKDGVAYTAGAAFPTEDIPGVIKTVLGLSASQYTAMSSWLHLDIQVEGAQWIIIVDGREANDTGSARSISGNILNSDSSIYTSYLIQQNP